MLVRKENEQLKQEVRSLKDRVSALNSELESAVSAQRMQRPASSTSTNTEMQMLREKERELRGLLVEKDSQISK
jgi:predicted RNase H-like nuclease (RuvC/YqgF family)